MTGGGSADALMRSVDWASTPLGSVESWPESLKTTVGTLLHSRHPMFLWWGPDLIQFYNDANPHPHNSCGRHAFVGMADDDRALEDVRLARPVSPPALVSAVLDLVAG